MFDDPELDVALLWVPRLDAPALRFAAVDPDRGASGATLGFPHGGAAHVAPAAVAGSYVAAGRDIYGDRRVSRRILELRAESTRATAAGRSSWPTAPSGASCSPRPGPNEQVGYALTPTSVATAVQPRIGPDGSGRHGRLHPLTARRGRGYDPTDDPDGIRRPRPWTPRRPRRPRRRGLGHVIAAQPGLRDGAR